MVMGLVTDLHREGHTIVMVTHDPEIGRMAERRIELHHGRLTEVSVFPSSGRRPDRQSAEGRVARAGGYRPY